MMLRPPQRMYQKVHLEKERKHCMDAKKSKDEYSKPLAAFGRLMLDVGSTADGSPYV